MSHNRQETKRAFNLVKGDVVDLEGFDVGEANSQIVQFEYVTVDSVNGGWADGMAAPGQVVLYSAQSLAEPVILPSDALIPIARRENDGT